MGLGPTFPIVIQGGISPGMPSTVGNIPQFAGSSPPDLLIDSILREVAGPPQAIIVGATDPSPLATETFRTIGGLISQGAAVGSIVLGQGAATQANNRNSIAIGAVLTGAVDVGVNNQDVVIGTGTTVAANAANRRRVIIGPNLTVPLSGNTSDNFVAVGVGLTFTAPNPSLARTVWLGSDLTCPAGAGSGCVVIGSQITVGANQVQAVLIGNGALGGGAGAIAIGNAAGHSGATGSNSIHIGQSSTSVLADGGCIAIGAQTQIADAASGGIAIGFQARVNAASSCAIGPVAQNPPANTIQFGGASAASRYLNTVFGQGVTRSAGSDVIGIDYSLAWTNISGGAADSAAGSIIVNAPRGTGAVATGGGIIFTTGVPGVSGSTTQVAANRMTIAGAVGTQATLVTIHGTAAELRMGTGGLSAFAAGILRYGGAQAWDIWQDGAVLTVSDKSSELQRLRFTGTGFGGMVILSPDNEGLMIENQVDHAGASVGTLTNAPAAGNPTFWLPVNIGGTLFAVPAWPV